jgi:hypothetical protein
MFSLDSLFKDFFHQGAGQREKALKFAVKLFYEHGIVGWQAALIRGSNLDAYLNLAEELEPKARAFFPRPYS